MAAIPVFESDSPHAIALRVVDANTPGAIPVNGMSGGGGGGDIDPSAQYWRVAPAAEGVEMFGVAGDLIAYEMNMGVGIKPETAAALWTEGPIEIESMEATDDDVKVADIEFTKTQSGSITRWDFTAPQMPANPSTPMIKFYVPMS